MKRFCSTALLCLLLSFFAQATPKYWVGASNGNWGDPANWSNVANGAGGATIPENQDSVIFGGSTPALVHMDTSPTIGALNILANTTLYAASPVTLTLLKTLVVNYNFILKDSTSTDVPFNIVLNGATGARGTVYGDWIFEGGVPLGNRLNSGAAFKAEPGSILNVLSITDGTTYFGYRGSQVIFKRNTGTIVSDKTSLVFNYNTNFIFDDNLDAKIPLATWVGDLLAMPDYGGSLRSPAATFRIRTNMEKLEYPEVTPDLAKVVIELTALSADRDLSLPNGSTIRGNLEITNTNGHTLTLLAVNSAASQVSVDLGFPGNTAGFGGSLVISGATTKVALARATDNPATNYFLKVRRDFNQSGGNFSLQDFNAATGNTFLEITNNFVQTAGTFYTNSTSTTAKLAVTMANPYYITGPSGSFQSSRTISASSGTIDNATHNITLRIDHSVYIINGYQSNLNGVILNSPLQVGRLELVRSPLTTTSVNVITVNNPSADAIVIGGPSSNVNNGIASGPTATSYVNGPIRRATNSSQPYFFPTGKGNVYVTTDFATYAKSFLYDSCYVIPASSTPSVYQAEYFRTGYPDVNVTAPLVGVSQNEYWDFSRISGADAQVKFKFTNPVISTGSSGTLAAAHYDNGHWVTAQGSTINPCAVTDSFILSKPMSSFSPFTLGYLNDANTPVVPSNLKKGLSYKFYHGIFTSLPDFNSINPVSTGVINNVDVSVRPVGADYNYAFKWDGFITITTPGTYTFETISDDGSKVYFNTSYCAGAAALVNNDGVHGVTSVKGTLNVTAAGTYPITITYFQNYSGQTMQLFWTGPGISRQAIPDDVFSYSGETTPPPTETGTGLNYKYYEGSFNSLPDFNILTPVKMGKSPNVDINVRTAGLNDNFAFTWDGTIKILTAGTYTFETVSDDGSRLTVNGNNLVNNDGLHAPTSVTGTVTLAAGVYPIAISYFEKDGGEAMQVYWTGPGITRQLIPDGVFGSVDISPQPQTYGLNYKYYEGDFNTLPDFSKLTPAKTGITNNADISIRPAGVTDHFAFVWEGTVNITIAGTYYFETVSDDGSKVFINGLPVVDNDGLHAANSVSKSISLKVGTYPIRVEYFEKDGGETMQLYWSAPDVGRQLIPDAAFLLTSAPPAPPATQGLNYSYYEGDWSFLPDYSLLTPVKTGTSANVDISVRPSGVNDHFAFIWRGYINIPAPGSYTFETISDDGSRVYFNTNYSVFGIPTVNNELVHAPTSASGMVTVAAAGKYPITVTYFEKDGGETMQLYWSGPGISRQLVPDAVFSTSNGAAGITAMSGTENISLASELINAGIRVYPNPFVERITIDYYNEGNIHNKVTVGIYDLNGKLMYNYQPANLKAGNNRWLLNLGSKITTSGIYMAQIQVNGLVVKSIKLVKEKK